MTGVRVADLAGFAAQLDDDVLRQYVVDVGEDAAGRPERAMAALRQASERMLRQLVDTLAQHAVEADARLLAELVPKLERGQFTTTLEKLRDRALITPGLALRFSQLWAWGSPAHHDQRQALGFTSVDVERQLGPLIDLIDHLRSRRGVAPLVAPAPSSTALPAGTPAWLGGAIVSLDARAPRPGRIELTSLAATLVWTTVADADADPLGHRFEAYDIDDAPWFFGRDELADRICERVRKSSRALISGASGSGKSSLVKAGVIPRLVRKGSIVVYLHDYRPGIVDLLDAVASRTAQDAVVVVADQLDHLLGPGVKSEDRLAVCDAIARVARAPSTALIGAVREDYLGALLRVLETDHAALAQALDPRASLMPVGPLGVDDAIEVLAQHLSRADHAFSRDLLATVLAPAVDRDDAIASVSPFVIQALLGELSRTGRLDEWRGRGVDAALRWHVEDAIRNLPSDRRQLARALVKEMGTPSGRQWVDAYALAAVGEVQLLDEKPLLLPGERAALDVVESTLTMLVERRLVVERRVGAAGARELTLAHDRLGEVVSGWRSPEDLERAQAQEELDRAIREQIRGRGDILSGRRLARVERHWRALRKDDGADHVLRRSRRARARLRAGFAGLAAIAIVALGFGAWQYRQVAQARERVEARRAESEKLLAFLLYDLRAKLERAGRVDVLEDVVEHAIAHFDRWPDDRSDETSRGRAASRCYLGLIRRAQGDLPAARAAYADGLARIAADPRRDQPAWRDLHADCLEAEADALMFEGDLPTALARYQELLDLSRAWLADVPDDPQHRQRVAGGLASVAEVQQRQGQLDEALVTFGEALAIRQALADAAPDDRARQYQLSTSLYKMGEVLIKQGKAPEALDYSNRAHDIRERMLAEAPGDQELQRRLVVTLIRTGDTLVATGSLDEALRRYRRCADILRPLIDRDPDNVFFYLRDLTVCRQLEGSVLLQQKRLDEAEAAYREILKTRTRLAAKDPSNGDWQYELAQAHEGLGLVLRERGDAAASEQLTRARDLLVALTHRAPWTVRWNDALKRVEAALRA